MPTNKVYNLVFPENCNEMEIFGYTFQRVINYIDRFKSLQHRDGFRYENHNIDLNSGVCAITATVETPSNEEEAILPWRYESMALKDVLLLLSLFTNREVFLKEEGYLKANQNIFELGNILNVCTPVSDKCKYINVVNQTYNHIRKEEWHRKYSNGFFLLLLKSAISVSLLEMSFLICWTIWEHIYSILKRGEYLSNQRIIGKGTAKKIQNILKHYSFLNLDDECKTASDIFEKTRNNLVHFGKFCETSIELENTDNNPILYYISNEKYIERGRNFYHAVKYNDKSQDDAMLFIYLTEVLTAKILGLQINDIMNIKSNLIKRIKENIHFIKYNHR